MELSSLSGLGRANLCNCRHFQAKGKEGPLMCLKCVTVITKWSVRGKSIARGWIEEPNYRLKAARYLQINVHMLACAHDTWQSAKSLNFMEQSSFLASPLEFATPQFLWAKIGMFWRVLLNPWNLQRVCKSNTSIKSMIFAIHGCKSYDLSQWKTLFSYIWQIKE